jgi:hypothetical protein
MWVGSNHRYEFPFEGGCIYNLKQIGACKTLYLDLAFYFNTAKDRIPNWKEGDNIQFGIAVLPDGHSLRRALPELAECLRSAALFEIREFFKVPHFKIEQYSGDRLIKHFIKNPLLLDRLLEGWDRRDAFDRWRDYGFPEGPSCINKPYIPFLLWDFSDTEIREAKALYSSKDNCIKVNVSEFYSYVSNKFPLFRKFYWGGVSEDVVATELIEYMKLKLGIKSNEE